jgi:ankyrin repeat protein
MMLKGFCQLLLFYFFINNIGYSDGVDLIRAAAKGDVAKVKNLITRGADVNARHELTRWTALGAAAFYGSPEIVQLLIKNGAHVNSMDAHHRTPLMKAVTLGPYQMKSDILLRKAQITRILLEAGANPYTPDGLGQPVWQMPVVDKYEELSRVLEQAKIKDSKEVGLISAIARMDVAMVQTMLGKGADVRFQDAYGWNALRQALLTANLKMVQIVVEAGADVNAKFPQGWTPLMLAVISRNPEIVQFLIQSKADLKAINDKGESAKDIARSQGDPAILAIIGL